jgi:hypothetical protein
MTTTREYSAMETELAAAGQQLPLARPAACGEAAKLLPPTLALTLTQGPALARPGAGAAGRQQQQHQVGGMGCVVVESVCMQPRTGPLHPHFTQTVARWHDLFTRQARGQGFVDMSQPAFSSVICCLLSALLVCRPCFGATAGRCPCRATGTRSSSSSWR